MMRTMVYILLFANFAFFAWAGWIDKPPRGSAMQFAAGLPQLELVTGATGAQAGTQSPSVVPPRITRCVSVGPFNTRERTQSAIVMLQERGLKPREREEQGEIGDGYWVFVGGLRSAADERRILRTLDQAALYDARVMPPSTDGS